MSPEHQEELVVTGKFRGYGGGTCNQPAEVGIETDRDRNPAPRFYCRPCAIAWLQSQTKEMRMSEETITALKNYDYMVRHRSLSDVAIYWESESLVYGDGGCSVDELCRPGFTPATGQ